MLRLSTAQRNVLSGLFIFCLIGIIYSLGYFPSPSSIVQDSAPTAPAAPATPAVPHSPPPPAKSENGCNHLAVPQDTVIIVKTGANELYEKLPTQLLTSLLCHDDDNLLFFSDLNEKLGPYTIHDALDSVNETVKSNNPHFDYYRTLQQYYKDGQSMNTIAREQTRDAAWTLDKYKFLHMLEKSWNLRPNRKWYVYIEADTYLVQSNLRLWLDRLDSSGVLYLGSPTYVNGVGFAHGGSGIVLSGTALSAFAKDDEGIAARYDEMMTHEMYGDYVLMKALNDKGVDFTSAWPMLQNEKPATIPYGPGPDNGVRHWCQPIVTMHHITPEEASQIWTFEQTRQDVTKPLLLKELYAGMVASDVYDERDDWYNLSDDRMYRAPSVNGDRQKPENEMTPIEKEAYKSFDHCRAACEEQDRCWQFAYTNQECGFSFSYRLGAKHLPTSDGKTYKSGWVLAKIEKDQAANPCSTVEWLPR